MGMIIGRSLRRSTHRGRCGASARPVATKCSVRVVAVVVGPDRYALWTQSSESRLRSSPHRGMSRLRSRQFMRSIHNEQLRSDACRGAMRSMSSAPWWLMPGVSTNARPSLSSACTLPRDTEGYVRSCTNGPQHSPAWTQHAHANAASLRGAPVGEARSAFPSDGRHGRPIGRTNGISVYVHVMDLRQCA